MVRRMCIMCRHRDPIAEPTSRYPPALALSSVANARLRRGDAAAVVRVSISFSMCTTGAYRSPLHKLGGGELKHLATAHGNQQLNRHTVLSHQALELR